MDDKLKQWAKEKHNKENDLYSLNYAIKNMTEFLKSDRCRPRPSDIKSYNTLIYNLKKDHDKIKRDQEPFTKLYLFLYLQFLRKRNLSQPQIKPAKIVTDLLSNDIDIIFQEIEQEINFNNLSNSLKDLSIDKFVNEMSEDEKSITKEELKKVDVDQLTKRVNYDDLKKSLINHINNILTDY